MKQDTSLFPENTIVIASHNAGKVREIAALLAPLQIKVLAASALHLPEPEETGTTFTANAVLKAQAAANACGFAALADDSGLCVAALDGAPGVYSARLAGADKNFSKAMEQLWGQLQEKGATDTSAYFECVLAIAFPQGQAYSFSGRVSGNICWPPRGGEGFGYDPFFIAQGYKQTFGELAAAEKHRISHRAQAFSLFTQWLESATAGNSLENAMITE